MLKSFAHHCITVSDLDRSVAFYRDLLHMKLERAYEAAGRGVEEATGFPGAHLKVAMMSYRDTSGDHRLKLIQYLSPSGRTRFEARMCDVGASHAEICVDQVQQVYEELTARGARFISPPVHPLPEHPERTIVFLLDPDGFVIEVHQSGPHHEHVVTSFDRGVDFYRNVLGMKLGFTVNITSPGIAEATGFPGAQLKGGRILLDTPDADEFADAHEFIELHEYVRPSGKKRSDIRLCDVGSSHVAFNVDDVQQSYRELKAKGVRFMSRPVRENAGGQESMMVYMLDQDDYVLELRSDPSPR
ncbi:MAG: VOC family protein [Chloroflexi bacterium]|nr:VOC family protein [Chloroflexota bacterium]